MKTTVISPEQEIWDLLNTIPDPEIPVISIVELGVIRSVNVNDGVIYIQMTPTYSGCPALIAMQDQVSEKLAAAGYQCEISLQYKPAWTTDWLSPETRMKLEDYGIAPPEGNADAGMNPFLSALKPVKCPFCKSVDTKLTSAFGSTACKSLHFCNACNQPFEHFKCH